MIMRNRRLTRSVMNRLLTCIAAACAATSAHAQNMDAENPHAQTKHTASIAEWNATTTGWRQVPFITQSARNAGVRIGGEGCQWPQAIDADQTDGSLLLFGTDVGGLWRSLDSGRTWQHANVGYTPRGTSDITIDPHFPSRALSVGSNSGASDHNGLYLTENHAASWRPVRTERISGHRDFRRQVAFDPATRDNDAGLTRVVYWSRTRETAEHWGEPQINPGFYTSLDGGRSWARVEGEASQVAAHSALAVHPSTGRLYAANDQGIFVSDDRAASFRNVLEGPVTSIATSPADPDTVWATRAQFILRSTDAGLTWTTLNTEGLDEPIAGEYGRDVNRSPRTNVVFGDIRVSPADANRLIIRSLADDWRWYRHISHDAGRTWTTAATDSTHAFMPRNARQAMFAWHPTDPDIVFSFGGDWPTRSTDGGRTFTWAGEGQNAVYVPGNFNLNPHHPGLLFLPSQDYNGALTTNAGYTWTYTPVSGFGWGGFNYAGIAISPDVIVTGHADGGWHVDRVLSISTDAGRTWTESPKLTWSHDRSSPDFASDVALVHPVDPDVAFIAGYRTDDLGRTWSAMTGCNGVFTAARDGTLFGTKQRESDADVVASADAGFTWRTVLTLPGVVDDLSVTPAGDRLYICNRDRAWALNLDTKANAPVHTIDDLELLDSPPTSTGRYRVDTVSVDPRVPNRVYIGQRIDQHVADKGVMRSDDAGATWTNLNQQTPLVPGKLDGGREPQSIRVDPHSGVLWVTTGCYGIWHYIPEDATQ